MPGVHKAPGGIRSAESSVAIHSARFSLRRGERPTIGSDEAPDRKAFSTKQPRAFARDWRWPDPGG